MSLDILTFTNQSFQQEYKDVKAQKNENSAEKKYA